MAVVWKSALRKRIKGLHNATVTLALSHCQSRGVVIQTVDLIETLHLLAQVDLEEAAITAHVQHCGIQKVAL